MRNSSWRPSRHSRHRQVCALTSTLSTFLELIRCRIFAAFDSLSASVLHVSPLTRLIVPCSSNRDRQQPNQETQATATEQWIRLILAYGRHRRLFTLRVEDAEAAGGDWDDILRNPRINRMCFSLSSEYSYITYHCHQGDCYPHIYRYSWHRWSRIMLQHTSPRSRHAQCCFIGVCQKNGPKSYIHG